MADFGNGRYVRTLVEKASIRQASRLMRKELDSITKKDAVTLLEEDFELESVPGSTERRAIGF